MLFHRAISLLTGMVLLILAVRVVYSEKNIYGQRLAYGNWLDQVQVYLPWLLW